MRLFMIGIFIFFSLIGRADAPHFEEVYVCVSASMPNDTLKMLFSQASSEGAKLVIRGLIKNSFQETRKKMEELEINVSIDPNIFEDFGVKSVPTVIGIKEGLAYKVSGNVSLREALKYLKEKSEAQ